MTERPHFVLPWEVTQDYEGRLDSFSLWRFGLVVGHVDDLGSAKELARELGTELALHEEAREHE